MGGRGASSGWSKDKHGNPKNPYGSQYRSVLTAGNVKFVSKNSRQSETLMETMTSGRVYAVGDRGKVKSIVYFDNDNKRAKQIDLADHHGISPHVHVGYLHNEKSPNGKPIHLSTDEVSMVDRVLSDWRKHEKGKQ